MATIVTRSGKGSPLTNTEVDNNFTNLNTAKYESGDNVSLGTGTFSGALSSTRLTINTSSGTGRYVNFVDNSATPTKYNWIIGTQQTQDNGFEITPSTAVGGITYSYPSISGTTGATVVNEGSQDRDFRIESDSNANMLFVDAGNNRVGINTGSPQTWLDINTGSNDSGSRSSTNGLRIAGPENSGIELYLDHSVNSYVGWAGTISHGNTGTSGSWGDAYVKIDVAGLGGSAYEAVRYNYLETSFNDGSNNTDFRVESDSNTHMLFVDAGNNTVSVGWAGDSGKNIFSVYGYSGAGVSLSSNRTDINFTTTGVAYTRNLAHGAITWHDTPAATTIPVVASGYKFGYGAYHGYWADIHTHTEGNTNAVGYMAKLRNSAQTSSYYFGYYADLTSVTVGDDIRYGFYADGEQMNRFGGGAIFNENSQDQDFRVESDTGTHALFVDAGNAAVVVNFNAPDKDHNDTYSEFTVVSKVGNGAIHAPFFAGRSVTGYQDGIVMGSVDNQAYITATNFGNYGNTSAAHTDLVLRTQASATRGDLREGIRIHSTGSVTINEGSGDQDFRVESDAKSHAFFVDASASLVMVGRDTATESTGVYGCIINATGSTSNIRTFGDGTAHYHYQFIHNTLGGVGSIVTTTSGTTFNTTSDRRLKENISAITDGTEKLMAMRPVTHTWIAQPDAPAVHGFIAQEMREIVPEAVSGTPDGEEMMSMDYGRITPILVAALQDAHKKIAGLEARLNILESK